jgi:hypothetical protein
MPRLHGYRERLYANFYDAVSILKMDDGFDRLFGNRNVGTAHLTNIACAGQLGYDSTFVLINVYTRTNIAKPRPTLGDAKQKEVRELFVAGHDGDAIGTLLRDLQWERSPLTRALEEWAHAAIVEVEIGNKPMFSSNFHDLMDGPSLGPGCPQRSEKVKVTSDGAEPPDQPLPWRKQLGRPIIVPVRQNVSVKITSHQSATRALRAIATAAGVLPDPLLWVHMEGLLTRDVA